MSIITMYGTPPIAIPSPMPSELPSGTSPLTPDWGTFRIVGAGEPRPEYTPPAIPESAEALRKRLAERAAWLENELRMHAAWQEELAIIKGMLAAPASAPCSSPPKGGGT